MGSRASSSERKLKRDKISSKCSQKKTRRKESKKHRHYYDSACSSSGDSERSFSTSKSNHKRRTSRIKKRRHNSSSSSSSSSSYSDYQSVSSSYSDSSSTDDYDYKNRKAGRSRVGIKDTKRKVHKKSTCSIADEDASSGRKRKRTGRDIRPIKKSLKKKPKKDLRNSSSSDSESCSACQSGSSTEGYKHRRRRVVSNKDKGRLRGRGWDKGKRKDRSRSCTLVGSSDEEFFPVDYTQRLRSVITIVDRSQDEEENRWEKDPHKEEIVDDQNDPPSAKNLESNEDGTKIDSDNQSNVALSDRICTNNIADKEVSEVEKSRTEECDDGIAGDCHSDRGFINNLEKERDVYKPPPVAAVGGDVLESILRQKALENLRKFKERPQAHPSSDIMKINNKTNEVELSEGKVDTIPNESTEQGSPGAQGSRTLLQRQNVEVVELQDNKQDEKKPNIMHSGNGAVLLHCSGDDKSACSRAVVAEAVEPTSGREQTKEVNEGSQFEQKTMSVMRGGELEQVSYKVYIPNKSHALARRQLRR